MELLKDNLKHFKVHLREDLSHIIFLVNWSNLLARYLLEIITEAFEAYLIK
jgi:SUMO ligase MMS21 Smc5/6 complex component